MGISQSVLLETRDFSLAQTSWYSRAFCSRICCRRMYFMCSSTLRTQFSKRTTMRIRFGHVCMMDTKVLWSARSTSWPLIDKMTSPIFFFFWLLKGRRFCWPVIEKFQMGFYYLLIQFFMFVWVFTWTETSSVGLTEWVDVINVSDNFYIVFVTIVDSIAL